MGEAICRLGGPCTIVRFQRSARSELAHNGKRRTRVRSRPHARWLDVRAAGSATHVAALVLEIERAPGRPPQFARIRRDGAAPLIGSSRAIRQVRERIERVAVTDFTILIEGGIGPQPHPSFIEVRRGAALGDRHGQMAGAG